MRLLVLHEIIYEVVCENELGGDRSTFFNERNPLRARENALTLFIETEIDRNWETSGSLVRVYARHMRTGKRVEILNTITYRNGCADFDLLVEEFQMYRKEKVTAPIATYDPAYPHLLTLLPAGHKITGQQNRPNTYVFLSQNHWLFAKRKKIDHQIA